MVAVLLFLSLISAPAHSECVDPASLQATTVEILRKFGPEEAAKRGSVAIAGTAWFYGNDRTLVTIGHVAEDVVPTDGWQDIRVSQEAGGRWQERWVDARVQRSIKVPENPSIRIVVLTLSEAFPGAKSVELRDDELVAGELLKGIGYTEKGLKVVPGTFSGPAAKEDGADVKGMSLAEMFDGNDRLALDHGASGGALFDCDGKAALIVNFVRTQDFMGNRISTAWGVPNVVAAPLRLLRTP